MLSKRIPDRCVRRAWPTPDSTLPLQSGSRTRQGNGAVVGEHIAVQRIELRVVDVGRDDALAHNVEHDDAREAAELAERALVQLSPHAR